MSEISEKLKPADLMRAIEYALRRSPVTETVFSEEGDFDTEITEPASLEAFATTLISEVVPHIMAAALSSAAVAEREPAYWAVHSKTGMHIGLWLHKSDADEALRGYEGGTITALYLDPPPTSELESENARLQREADNWLTLIAAERQKTDAAEARLAEALKALNLIDALDPEEHVYGCSADALRGIVIQMGQIARRVREGGKVDG